jgi:hypothetical protein
VKKFVLLLTVFFSLSVWAQDDQSDDTEEETQVEQQVLDTELSPEELAAAEDDELILGTDGGGQENEDENSNSRFVPTEQISQDLGVSFPVDI